jgi:hypothetical protein
MEVGLGSLDIFSLGDALSCNRLLVRMLDFELIDRLYRRYVRKDDVLYTGNILSETLLRYKNGKEKKLLARLVDAYTDQAECSELAFKRCGEYFPIRLFLTASPYRYLQIPLEDYDKLEGDPLWMRPEYMLEKYYPKEKQEKDRQTLEKMKKDHPDWF